MHFTTAFEIKSYQEHPQKHKPQEMTTQYACNKGCFMISKCKTFFLVRQKRDLLSQSLECYMHCVVLVTFARERKEEKPLFKQTLKVTFRPYHELMMFCLACQLLFLTGYYFTIYAKQNTLPAGRLNTISDGVKQTSLSACNKGNRRRLLAGNVNTCF